MVRAAVVQQSRPIRVGLFHEPEDLAEIRSEEPLRARRPKPFFRVPSGNHVVGLEDSSLLSPFLATFQAKLNWEHREALEEP